MENNSCGFSLIELLIVVAIVLIVAAIAIPNFLRSRIAANQASAVGSLRIRNTSMYNSGYAVQLSYLGPGSGSIPAATGAGLIDSILAGTGGNASSKRGYNFTYSPGAPDGLGRINDFQFNSNPTTPGTTGQKLLLYGSVRRNSPECHRNRHFVRLDYRWVNCELRRKKQELARL